MGTRHLIGISKNNEYKVMNYCQWDGYPSAAGCEILEFLRDTESVEKLKSNLKKCRFLGDEDEEFIDQYNKNPTDEQKQWYARYVDRDVGRDILYNIANSEDEEILLKDSTSFAADSLFCEWAYVIDFDKNKLEIYKGFQKSRPLPEDRFYFLKDETENEYSIIKKVKEYDLNDLPTEDQMIKDCDPREEDED